VLERIILLAASLDLLLTKCLAERLVVALKKLIHSTFRVMPARSTDRLMFTPGSRLFKLGRELQFGALKRGPTHQILRGAYGTAVLVK
jgi:hypothetical protein